MHEVIASSGKHYRIHPTDPSTIQMQDGSCQRWRHHVTCMPGAAGTGAEVARAWLMVLGHVQQLLPEDTQP